MPKYKLSGDECYPVYEIVSDDTEKPWYGEIVELSEEDAKEFIKVCGEWNRWQERIRELVDA